MKCIKAIKSTKSVEAGQISRVDENDAEMKVKTGFWQYVPKSEWKAYTRPVEVKKEKTIKE